MKTKTLFKDFEKINKILDGKLVEISIRQHQIGLVLNKTISVSQIQKFLPSIPSIDNSFVTFHDDFLYFIIEELHYEDINTKSYFHNFMQVINAMSEEICQCPALEYVVSSQYVKCFLDKNGLTIADLSKYESILESETPAEVEMHPQRPYLLFINFNNNDKVVE